jgi:hypothetical protein
MGFWEYKINNPNVMLASEKKLWNEIEPVLNGLLDELRVQGKIETIYTQAEKEDLLSAVEKLDRISEAHNTLLDIIRQQRGSTEGQRKRETFLKQTAEFGFNEQRVVFMYLALAVTVEVLSTELFKLRLLFHMKDVDFAVSHFSTTMSSAAQISWPKLKPYVDNEFRNSLSHGTWAVINHKIVLFKDAKLLPSSDPEAKMSLHRFMMRIKSQNVLYQCLINVLDKKAKSGFFMP